MADMNEMCLAAIRTMVEMVHFDVCLNSVPHREDEDDVDKEAKKPAEASKGTKKASGGGKKEKKGKKKDGDWYGGDGSFGCMFRHSELTGRMKMMWTRKQKSLQKPVNLEGERRRRKEKC